MECLDVSRCMHSPAQHILLRTMVAEHKVRSQQGLQSDVCHLSDTAVCCSFLFTLDGASKKPVGLCRLQ